VVCIFTFTEVFDRGLRNSNPFFRCRPGLNSFESRYKSSRLNGKSRRKKILSSQFCQCTGIAGILPLPVTALPYPLNSYSLLSVSSEAVRASCNEVGLYGIMEG
jgi:hypothetical protein